MSVKKKNVIRNVKSARKLSRKGAAITNASIEEQIASLEEQIALLKSEPRFSQDSQDEQDCSESWRSRKSCENRGSDISPRAQLTAPVIESVTAVGAHSLKVSWNAVTGSTGYLVRYSQDKNFLMNVSTVASSPATVTLNNLQTNATYYVSVQAVGYSGPDDSPFSAAKSARTGISAEGDTVTHLQNMFAELETVFQNFSVLVPQLETTDLNTAQRRRLLGSGVRRYGFIEKVFEVSGDFPQFWPHFGEGRDELSEYVKEIDVLRNMLVWFRFASRVVQDLLLIAGDNAFRVAGAYYAFARESARQRNPAAVQVFDMLRLFWRKRRRTNGEPTMHEVLRDTRALLRGKKDGTVTISNESDQVVKGEKIVIDNTMRKPRGGMKVVERGEVE